MIKYQPESLAARISIHCTLISAGVSVQCNASEQVVSRRDVDGLQR